MEEMASRALNNCNAPRGGFKLLQRVEIGCAHNVCHVKRKCRAFTYTTRLFYPLGK